MKVQRRPITPDEKTAIFLLQGVTFPPASWDKRFARNIVHGDTITEKEASQVWRLFKRYRRQINHPHAAWLLAIAETLAAPDFRSQRAAQEAEARIAQMRAEQSQPEDKKP